MACGTPHALSDNINVRSADWFQGLMYKQLDHRDLAEKIVQLLSDKKLRRKIREDSRKVALELCDLEEIMRRWETVYHKVKGYARFGKGS
jgi:glycosyltransferase involved in cell wall biosynthesis